MTILGYARVSTKKQSLEAQRDALVAAGVDPARIYEDHGWSGTRADRPGLAALLDYAREGDEIVVVALDRLGRSMNHVLSTVEDLTDRGIKLRSLREGIDYSTPTGRLWTKLLSILAEYERELIKERAAAAREAAAERGRHIGRPRALTPEQVQHARTLREAGTSITAIAAVLGTSRMTIHRAVDGVRV